MQKIKVGYLSCMAHQPLWVIQCQIRFTYMNYIWFVTIFYMNSLFLHKLTFLLNLCFYPFNAQVGAKNKVMAINTLAIPVMTYSFNISNWALAVIRKMDTKSKKLITCHRMPRTDREHLNVKRKWRKRINPIKIDQKTITTGLTKYLDAITN